MCTYLKIELEFAVAEAVSGLLIGHRMRKYAVVQTAHLLQTIDLDLPRPHTLHLSYVVTSPLDESPMQ